MVELYLAWKFNAIQLVLPVMLFVIQHQKQ